jgi:HAD domain in Swiss Army Knife RNA repair proteins
MNKKLLIFLDFDGVLHPILCQPEKFFCRKHLFENVIREFKKVEIIISSSWRHQYEFEELVNFFALDIQKLIVGCTRSVEISKAKNRYEEIIDFLTCYERFQEPWLAIDDSRDEFPIFCPNLLHCNRHKGFDEEASLELIQLLSKCLKT